jgi:hypothetical protein
MKISAINQRLWKVVGDQEVVVGQTAAEKLESGGYIGSRNVNLQRTAIDKVIFPDGAIFEFDVKITRQSSWSRLNFMSSYNKKNSAYCWIILKSKRYAKGI